MLRIIAYLAFLVTLQTCVKGQLDSTDLSEMFADEHHLKLADQALTNKRLKRDVNEEDDYTYHGMNNNPHSLSLMNGMQKSSDESMINDYATTGIKVSMKLLSSKRLQSLPTNPLAMLQSLKAPEKFCPFKKQIVCDTQFPYRSLDGSCNNLNNTWWGKTGTPYKRWMPADYSDQFKLNEPRAATDGSELPNARLLSCALNIDKHDIEPAVSHILMQWGQFVNHDITSLSITREDDPDQSICKTCTKTHKCLPIMITSNTTCNCVKTMKHNCIEFTRSSASFGDTACSLGPREQINMQTAFLDGSHIYGANEELNRKLRTGTSGLLRLQERSANRNEDLLPASVQERPSDCLDFTPTTKCFVAGDDRVNQNPGLMSMHTIFAREHNRIARIMSANNPSWSDELLFQEARRLVIAQIQHITYNEYLPILLGADTMKLFGLSVGQGATKLKMYDPSVDPRISNEYSASAGRFGHSMIRTDYSRLNSEYKSTAKSFLLRNSYFRANDLYDKADGGLESIMRGMLVDPLMSVDRWFTTELTQHLFETKNRMKQPFHFDLASININRGRDHGVGGYLKFRDFCGLEPVRTWADMRRFVDPESVEIYRSFYRSPADVDLFLAAISEFKQPDRLVGPTLSCLIGLQFQSMKFGDRFWYETLESPGDFTFGQLFEIRKTSLAKVLCRNMNETPKIQPLAFISQQEKGNELIDCNNLPDFNWKFWQA